MSLPQRIIDDVLQRHRSTALTPRKQRHAAKPEVTAPAESGRGPVVRVADLAPPAKPRPEHYKVICISLYEAVRDLRAAGGGGPLGSGDEGADDDGGGSWVR